MSSQRLFILRRLTLTTFQLRRSLHKDPKSFFDFLTSTKVSVPKPPFDHIVQIGDPILRTETQKVNLDRLSSPEIKFLLRSLKQSLDNYDAVGVSAPQLGVALNVFAVQVTKRQISGWSPETIQQRGLVPIPCRFFINPELKIVNSEQITDREGCCSVYGYSGSVSRAREVQVRAFDENGQPVTWVAKGWMARVVQHEMDHLKGSKLNL